MSDLEALFFTQLAKAGIERPLKDWRFYAGQSTFGAKGFTIQYAWPAKMVAVEIIDGPLYDPDAHHALIEKGFHLIVFVPRYLRSGDAIKSIKKALENGSDT